jgi:hypothetical protein
MEWGVLLMSAEESLHWYLLCSNEAFIYEVCDYCESNGLPAISVHLYLNNGQLLSVKPMNRKGLDVMHFNLFG